MKRNIVVVVLVILLGGTIAFYARDNAPKISGVEEDIYLHVGEEYNVLETLTVQDDRDDNLIIEQSGGGIGVATSEEVGATYLALYHVKDSGSNFTGEWQHVHIIE